MATHVIDNTGSLDELRRPGRGGLRLVARRGRLTFRVGARLPGNLPGVRSPSMTLAAAAVSGALLLSGCSALGIGADDQSPTRAAATSSPSVEDETSVPEQSETPVDPDTPTSWGPTVGEVEEARALVSDWTPEQLAGQVIVGRFHGTDPAEPAALVRDLHLAGVSVTTANILDESQVLAMNAAITRAAAEDGRDVPAGDRRRPGGRLRLPPRRHRHRLPPLPVRGTRDRGRPQGGTPRHPRRRPDHRAGAARPGLHLGLRARRRRHHRRGRPHHRRPLTVARHRRGGDRHRVGDQGLRRCRHRLDGQALPGPRHRDDRQPRLAAAGRLEPGRDRGARPAALRGGDREERSRGDAQPPRPDRHRTRRPGQHGARGLRAAARRPGLRGRHHHRLARHGCGRWPAEAGGPGAQRRRRPAPDAGGHPDDPRDRRRGHRVGRGLARARRGGCRPGGRAADVAGPRSPPSVPCPRDVAERARAASAALEAAAY